MKLRVFRYATSTLALVGLILLMSGILPVASWLSRPLIDAQVPRQADAIVILGGGVDDDHTPSALTLYRLRYGLQLFKQGYAPLVILTGGNPDVPAWPESKVMENVAIADFGIPPSALLVEQKAARTVMQARAVAEIARGRGIRSILLVTSPLHSYRAARCFQNVGLEVISTPARPVRRTGAPSWIELRPYNVLLRIGALGNVGYEWGAVALYRWRGWI